MEDVHENPMYYRPSEMLDTLFDMMRELTSVPFARQPTLHLHDGDDNQPVASDNIGSLDVLHPIFKDDSLESTNKASLLTPVLRDYSLLCPSRLALRIQSRQASHRARLEETCKTLEQINALSKQTTGAVSVANAPVAGSQPTTRKRKTPSPATTQPPSIVSTSAIQPIATAAPEIQPIATSVPAIQPIATVSAIVIAHHGTRDDPRCPHVRGVRNLSPFSDIPLINPSPEFYTQRPFKRPSYTLIGQWTRTRNTTKDGLVSLWLRRVSDVDFGFLDGIRLSPTVLMHPVAHCRDCLTFQFAPKDSDHPVHIVQARCNFYSPETRAKAEIDVPDIDSLEMDVMQAHMESTVGRSVVAINRYVGDTLYRIRCVRLRLVWTFTKDDEQLHESDLRVCYGIMQSPSASAAWRARFQ